MNLDDLIEAIGPDSTRELLRRRGGTRIYLPAPEGIGGSVLAEIVGEENARVLAASFGPGDADLPSGSAYARRDRDNRIIEASASGASLGDISAYHGLTRRQVRNIIAAMANHTGETFPHQKTADGRL
jgi:Mor family transcriptional regulator